VADEDVVNLSMGGSAGEVLLLWSSLERGCSRSEHQPPRLMDGRNMHRHSFETLMRPLGLTSLQGEIIGRDLRVESTIGLQITFLFRLERLFWW
jgi:hypothetical protein